MNTETSNLGSELVSLSIQQILQSIDEGTKAGYRWVWDAYMSLLADHWLAVTIILTVILTMAVIRAFSGHWGMLGRVLYNYLYFGTLLVVGLIKGPEVFVSEYFEIFCLLLLYPVCYFLVGFILNWLGVRKRY